MNECDHLVLLVHDPLQSITLYSMAGAEATEDRLGGDGFGMLWARCSEWPYGMIPLLATSSIS